MTLTNRESGAASGPARVILSFVMDNAVLGDAQVQFPSRSRGFESRGTLVDHC
jgi:hypothetical protein